MKKNKVKINKFIHKLSFLFIYMNENNNKSNLKGLNFDLQKKKCLKHLQIKKSIKV